VRSRPRAPLPAREGVAPSRVYLPHGPWRTTLDFFVERFRFVDPQVLRARLLRGEIVDEAGHPEEAESAYRPGRWLWYYREVPDESPVPFELEILHRDARLVVVDKPHFLASIPGGRYLRETALTRLRHHLSLPELSPVHRLDRETAGVMLFCADPASRGAYQSLFQSREVSKVYEAVAPLREDLALPLRYCSRLVAAPTHFTMMEAPGEPNSETRIALVRRLGTRALYCLQPATGRKHQLRAHMSALGMPICHDAFYPALQPETQRDDYARPLQLLARSVSFVDPFSGELRCFESRRSLALAGDQG